MSETIKRRRIRLAEVIYLTGISKSEIYRQIQRDEFPPSHRQSHRVAFWFEHEVQAWTDGRWEPVAS